MTVSTWPGVTQLGNLAPDPGSSLGYMAVLTVFLLSFLLSSDSPLSSLGKASASLRLRSRGLPEGSGVPRTSPPRSLSSSSAPPFSARPAHGGVRVHMSDLLVSVRAGRVHVCPVVLLGDSTVPGPWWT